MTHLSLPPPLLINGLSYIPPPSSTAFEKEFAGLLPPGQDIHSSHGPIHYYDFNHFNPHPSPTAKKVLIIHGIGTSAIGMAPLALRLSKSGHHVVLYDLWGHGTSATPLQPHTPALMHMQIFEILAGLRWLGDKVHFIGFSLGGSILATFAAVYPNIVETAVIIAGAGLWRKGGKGSWNNLRSADGEWIVNEENDYIIIDELEDHAPNKDGWKERLKMGIIESEPIERWERDNHKGHMASVVSLFRYGNVFDQHESYRKLLTESGIKTKVIVGEEDNHFSPEFVKMELAELGWEGEVVQVNGAGHGLVRSHVEEVVGLIEGFWVLGV